MKTRIRNYRILATVRELHIHYCSNTPSDASDRQRRRGRCRQAIPCSRISNQWNSARVDASLSPMDTAVAIKPFRYILRYFSKAQTMYALTSERPLSKSPNLVYHGLSNHRVSILTLSKPNLPQGAFLSCPPPHPRSSPGSPKSLEKSAPPADKPPQTH